MAIPQAATRRDAHERGGRRARPCPRALLVSGIYDLEPVRLSSRNEYLNLDQGAARDLSPIERIPSVCRPLVIGWGGRELDEFQRQSSTFAAVWEKHGAVEQVFMAEHNHFDMTSELGRPESSLLQPFIDRVLSSDP